MLPLAPSRRDVSRRQIRKSISTDANTSMERALRSISSPTNSKLGSPMNPRFASPKSKKRNGRSMTKKASEESVKVAVRIRPLGSNSSNENLIRAFRAGNNSVVEDSKGEYNYDKVFGEETDTTQIYSELVKDIVSSVGNDGLNGTIFTYGQTSSGKTFTMQGVQETEGLIQYAARDIFNTIEQHMKSNSESAVKISYVEIYNEELRDLLSDKRKSNQSSLVIREDRKGVIAIENLKEVAVRNLDQLMQVFRVGEANKSMGSTKMNDRSSRSHAILQITVEKKTTFNAPAEDYGYEKENNQLTSPKNNSFMVKTSSTLNLVDLAGSESVRLTGATGQQKKEGGMINQSLLTLSKVLMSLGQKNPGHVNYRDSKLTRILKPSLSGNARMAVICCISPSDNYIDETRSTLQFATRAKLVTTNAATNEVIGSHLDVVAKLRLDLEKARLANERLELQNQELKLAAAGPATTQAERKELDNLKRFLYDDSQRSGDKRLSYRSKYFTDEDIASNNKVGDRCQSAVKDDSCVPHSDCGDELLRIALADKAKQVKELQEEIAGSKSVKKQQHSRFSIAAYRDIDHYKSQTEELEAKLTNANNLITSLGNQIDELSTHKNDALDWIEELFAKIEMKDSQISQAKRERDDALAKCKSLSNEIAKTNQLLEFTIDEKEDNEARLKAMRSEVEALQYCVNSTKSANEKICIENQDTADLEHIIADLKSERDELTEQNDKFCNESSQHTNRINELEHKCHLLQSNTGSSHAISSQTNALSAINEELQDQVRHLKSQVQSEKDASSIYEEERRCLIDRLDRAESELSTLQLAYENKSGELDDLVFSLESERKSKIKEMVELQKQVERSCVNYDEMEVLLDRFEASEKALAAKSKELEDAFCVYDNEKECMMEEIEVLRKQSKELEAAASQNNSQEYQSIIKENSKLKSELRHFQTQLQSAKQSIVDFDNESMHMEETIVELSERLKEAQQRAKEAEEAALKKRSKDDSEYKQMEETVAHIEMKSQELCGKLKQAQQAKKEAEETNLLLKKRDRELRLSVARVREIVDNLASENEKLKERNRTLEMELSEIRSQLDHDRQRTNDIDEANAALIKTFTEREEELCLKLDKMAADFEADYETLRHQLDDVSREKAELEHKLDIASREKGEIEQQFIMLEASKLSIEENADRILERDNALSNKHDRLHAELKNATRELGERQDENNQLTKRLACIRQEIERLTHDNAALVESVKFTTQKMKSPDIPRKKRKVFEYKNF